MNFRTTINVDGQRVETLADILPQDKKLKLLFIGKTPAPPSVEKGHYFQGRQGKMFWNKLTEFGILKIEKGTFEDENLGNQHFGITDIVKVPRHFGNEPTINEYKEGLERIEKIITDYSPRIIVFVYKRVLDNILKLGYNRTEKSKYGMNKDLKGIFNPGIFVFPMPGTPCTKEEADKAMSELKEEVLQN